MLVLHGESLTPNSLTPLQRVGIPPHPTYFLQVVWPTRRADPASFSVDIVSDVTAEIDLGSLLQRVMVESTRMINEDRSTLFLNDE